MRVRVSGAVLAAGGMAAAVVLAGCGSGSSGSTASGAGSASSGGGTGTAVTVDASEYVLTLPSNHLAPGAYTFTMDNVGHATHAIELAGPGIDHATSSTAGPGGAATLTVTLQPGSYEMWCPVGNHKQAGMDTTITVG